jgi:hypothetical protein
MEKIRFRTTKATTGFNEEGFSFGVLMIALIPNAVGFYGLTNLASYYEGKGLRLVGGLLDVLLLTSSAVLVHNVLEHDGEPNTFISLPIVIKAASTGATYTMAKYFIGSPTSITTNYVVGTAGGYVPAIVE